MVLNLGNGGIVIGSATAVSAQPNSLREFGGSVLEFRIHELNDFKVTRRKSRSRSHKN
jgi:hypothetical protein